MLELKNEFGEPIEIVSNITVNLGYWDCECEENYIHETTFASCARCSAIQDEQPNSREGEVLYYKHNILKGKYTLKKSHPLETNFSLVELKRDNWFDFNLEKVINDTSFILNFSASK